MYDLKFNNNNKTCFVCNWEGALLARMEAMIQWVYHVRWTCLDHDNTHSGGLKTFREGGPFLLLNQSIVLFIAGTTGDCTPTLVGQEPPGRTAVLLRDSGVEAWFPSVLPCLGQRSNNSFYS